MSRLSRIVFRYSKNPSLLSLRGLTAPARHGTVIFSGADFPGAAGGRYNGSGAWIPVLIPDIGMAISLTCTCGARLEIDDKFAGKVVNLSGQADAKRLVAFGRLQLGTNLSPGEYVLQVVVTDALAKEKNRVASQWIEFEIK